MVLLLLIRGMVDEIAARARLMRRQRLALAFALFAIPAFPLWAMFGMRILKSFGVDNFVAPTALPVWAAYYNIPRYIFGPQLFPNVREWAKAEGLSLTVNPPFSPNYP